MCGALWPVKCIGYASHYHCIVHAAAGWSLAVTQLCYRYRNYITVLIRGHQTCRPANLGTRAVLAFYDPENLDI